MNSGRPKETQVLGLLHFPQLGRCQEVFTLESVRDTFWTDQRIGATLKTNEVAECCRHIEC